MYKDESEESETGKILNFSVRKNAIFTRKLQD